MTITNPEAFCAGLWDWAILDGCFGGSIKPTDIEGLVERNGYFLLIETKGPEVNLPDGQRYTFEALFQTGLFTILIAWGETNNPQRLELWAFGKKLVYPQADLELMRKCCAWWYRRVNNGMATRQLELV